MAYTESLDAEQRMVLVPLWTSFRTIHIMYTFIDSLWFLLREAGVRRHTTGEEWLDSPLICCRILNMPPRISYLTNAERSNDYSSKAATPGVMTVFLFIDLLNKLCSFEA